MNSLFISNQIHSTHKWYLLSIMNNFNPNYSVPIVTGFFLWLLFSPVCIQATTNNLGIAEHRINHLNGNFDKQITNSYRQQFFSTTIKLSDVDEWYYEYAISEAKENNWTKVSAITQEIHTTDSISLYIKSLFELDKYDELLQFVDKIPEHKMKQLFDGIIEYYVLSALELAQYDHILVLLESQRDLDRQLTNYWYKRILYTLIKNHDYKAIITLIDVFPDDIYLEGEQNYILGVVNYHKGSYSTARDLLHNIPKEALFYNLAHNYLSLIYYYSEDLESIPNDLQSLSEEVKFNYALTLLKLGKLDDASSIALKLEQAESKNLINLLIAWEMKHYRTAYSLLNDFYSFSPTGHKLTTLIMAETYLFLDNYREAEWLFKHYTSFENADIKYANHALGYCFNSFYRFDNAVYFWNQNLDTHKSHYDSLAAYNLSLLYAKTERYSSANDYFNYFNDKYGLKTNDKVFIESYLTTLLEQQLFLVFKDKFNKLQSILPDKLKLQGMLTLGDYFNNLQQYQKAVNYYQEALHIEHDDNLLLKIERLRFSMGEYKDSEDFIISLIDKYPNSSFNKQLSLDLTKYYISQNKLQQAGNLIDSLLVIQEYPDLMVVDENSAYTDSLVYYKALVQKEAGNLTDAKHLFIELHRNLRTDNLRLSIVQHLDNIFSRTGAQKAITFLNELIEDESRTHIHKDYLILLAQVYENQSLYGEANKIYQLLLEEDENYDYYYYLAINEIRQRNYNKTLNYIEAFKDKTESVNEDIQFLSYLAYYSLDEKEKAVDILLDLYYDYPDSPKRFEFLKNIIEFFIENDYDLFAWYFLYHYYPQATNPEKWILDRYNEQLEPKTAEDSLKVEEVNNFRKTLSKYFIYPIKENNEN